MNEVFNRKFLPKPDAEKFLIEKSNKEFMGCLYEFVKIYHHKGIPHTKKGTELIYFYAPELKRGDVVTRERDGAKYKVLRGGKHDGVRGKAEVKRMVQP